MLDFKFPDPCAGGLSESTNRKATRMLSNRPPTPSAHSLGIEYEPTFDDDDEYVTDDNCSLASRRISFCRRPLPPLSPPSSLSSGSTPIKVVSLLTLKLERYRASEAAAHAEEDEPLTDEDLGFVGQSTVNQQALDDALADALAEPDGVFPEQPTRRQEPAIKQQRAVPIITRTEAPRKTAGLLAIFKKVILKNLTRCGHNKQQQPTRSRTNNGEQQEEEDPYFLFFGDNNNNNQNQPNNIPRKKKKTQEQQQQPQQVHDVVLPIAETPTPTPTATAPIDIPLTQEQKDAKREFYNLNLPLRTGKLNDAGQISRAGPYLSGVATRCCDVAYVESDGDWVCCGCSSANSRFEFLCWLCQEHSKGACCEAMVEGIDGLAGYGVGGMW
ncbi:hypothetical protein C8A00DRAFT_30319 [Chaetomidium leptoderma]|uniref:RanBP2-type domain-containing protein n=1 Tax=Chaetomidium leptoderma TaxID=669021 RepID=A0AAN6VS27_9PEZI|nr:hypothetical protein C8A00DRAFT_30319 [Chaetomidium leptoderma]